tara:strand:- start:337 stop:813 length:477 start_codon:yes stop_codon:yes gene_type:complete
MNKFGMIFLLSMVSLSDIAFSDDSFNKKQLFDNEGMDHKKLNYLERFLDLDKNQKIAVKSIMDDSSRTMKESKSRMIKNKEALSNLDPNNKNFKDELLNLANEISDLIREQTILLGETKYNINNQLNDEQKEKIAIVFSRIERRGNKRNIKWRERSQQ